MSFTLAEVAEKTGRPEATLRKLIQRGQLHVEKEGNRTFVTEEALESFMAAEVLEDIADEVRDLNWGPARALVARLPDRIRQMLMLGVRDARNGSIAGVATVSSVRGATTVRDVPQPQFRPAPKPSRKKR